MSDEQARNQMIYNEIALNDILGYIPTYMRFVVHIISFPPFISPPTALLLILSDQYTN